MGVKDWKSNLSVLGKHIHSFTKEDGTESQSQILLYTCKRLLRLPCSCGEAVSLLKLVCLVTAWVASLVMISIWELLWSVTSDRKYTIKSCSSTVMKITTLLPAAFTFSHLPEISLNNKTKSWLTYLDGERARCAGNLDSRRKKYLI